MRGGAGAARCLPEPQGQGHGAGRGREAGRGRGAGRKETEHRWAAERSGAARISVPHRSRGRFSGVGNYSECNPERLGSSRCPKNSPGVVKTECPPPRLFPPLSPSQQLSSRSLCRWWGPGHQPHSPATSLCQSPPGAPVDSRPRRSDSPPRSTSLRHPDLEFNGSPGPQTPSIVEAKGGDSELARLRDPLSPTPRPWPPSGTWVLCDPGCRCRGDSPARCAVQAKPRPQGDVPQRRQGRETAVRAHSDRRLWGRLGGVVGGRGAGPGGEGGLRFQPGPRRTPSCTQPVSGATPPSTVDSSVTAGRRSQVAWSVPR